YLHAWGLEFEYEGEPVSVFCTPSDGEYFAHNSIADWLAQAPHPNTLNWPKSAVKSRDKDI
ncbi:MAG TPA: TIGR01621 family pseudouridine synthase, partial [Alteromonas sp.]|nr:TIGR01621 family pseudouridine synthase [Alteromonas sp.]